MVKLAVAVLVIRRKIKHRLIGGFCFFLQRFEFHLRHIVNITTFSYKVNRKDDC